MEFHDIADGVARSLRRNLTQLVEAIQREDLTRESFERFLAGLKAALHECGREAFVETMHSLDHPRTEVVDEDGKRHRFKKASRKEWFTPFGRVSVDRRYYQPDAGGKGIVPLDQSCGMAGRYFTPDIEELTAHACSMLVPSEVREVLSKALPEAPSCTAIKRVLSDVGAFIEGHEEELEAVFRKEAPLSAEGDVLVVSWDGTCVPLRESGAKRGRHAKRPGVRDDNESPTTWREAGVGAISIYGTKDDELERFDTRYLGRMPEPRMAGLVQRQAAIVKELRENRVFREVAVICDGKRSIWKDAESTEAYRGATFVLDFYHALENVSKAAEAIFGSKSDKSTRWFKKYRHRLAHERGAVQALLRSLRYYAAQRAEGTARRKTIESAIGYVQRNAERMRYAEFREAGLPIGSGPVEAGCKNLVGARLKRSGMRWTRTGGQHVLNLRSLCLSGRWEPMWSEYRRTRAA